jgi:hypothetical protein
MEEVVRKLEEGADPDSLEEQLGGADPASDPGGTPEETKAGAKRLRARRRAPERDPRLHEYP